MNESFFAEQRRIADQRLAETLRSDIRLIAEEQILLEQKQHSVKQQIAEIKLLDDKWLFADEQRLDEQRFDEQQRLVEQQRIIQKSIIAQQQTRLEQLRSHLKGLSYQLRRMAEKKAFKQEQLAELQRLVAAEEEIRMTKSRAEDAPRHAKAVNRAQTAERERLDLVRLETARAIPPHTRYKTKSWAESDSDDSSDKDENGKEEEAVEAAHSASSKPAPWAKQGHVRNNWANDTEDEEDN